MNIPLSFFLKVNYYREATDVNVIINNMIIIIIICFYFLFISFYCYFSYFWFIYFSLFKFLFIYFFFYRPDWEKCGDYVQGGIQRWKEISEGKGSNELVDLLLQEMGSGGFVEGGAEYFDAQVIYICDRVALHLPRQAVASLEAFSIMESFLWKVSVLLVFCHLAMHNKSLGSLRQHGRTIKGPMLTGLFCLITRVHL
jgi:hypothetical protein